MLANWIKQTTTSTGAGALTLAAVTGYPAFNDVIGLSRRAAYAILDSNGLPIEEGIGYLSDATTWVREKITGTYSAGVYDDTSPVAVSLSASTYQVICTGTATAIQGASKGINRLIAAQKMICSQHLTVNNGSSTGYTSVANRLTFIPFWLTSSAEIDGLAVRCGTGVAGSNVRIGVYDVTSDGHPGKLLGETGALSMATSGVDVIGSIASPVRLQPGWYFLAMVTDGAPAMGRIELGGQGQSFMGFYAGSLMTANSGLYVTFTFGPLPSPAPTTGLTGVLVTGNLPAIFARTV